MVAYCQEVRKVEEKFDGFDFIISSDVTMRRPTPLLDSGLVTNSPRRACSYKTSSIHPSGSMKMTRHLHWDPAR
jgi:hypothetical protein